MLPTTNHKQWIKALRALEFGLLVSGLILFGLYAKRRIFAKLESQQALNDFAAGWRQEGQLVGNNGPIDVSLWSPGRIKAYQDSLHAEIPPPIAVLKIPKIRLEVPVFDGTEDTTLDRGVGRIQGTSWPGNAGNIGIAGHRDGFFRGLKDIEAGDSLELMMQEEVLTFVVDRTEIVDPSDVSVLRPRDTAAITLVTCYPFYYVGHAPQRYIVEARLSGEVPIAFKKDLRSAKQ